MARQCRGLCKGPGFSRKRLSWDKGSFCPMCSEPGEYEVWVRDPTHKRFDDLFLKSIPDPHSYPHYFDIEGRQREVTILLPLKQIAWNTRDEKGEFIKMIEELVTKVRCPCCHTICRGSSVGKKDKRSRKDRQRQRQKNTIPSSVKVKQIDDIQRMLETQIKYENDPSLRLDDPEAKKAGTIGSMKRGPIESALEGVEKLRREIELKRKRK